MNTTPIWQRLKGGLRALAPLAVRNIVSRRRVAKLRARNYGRVPRELFSEIYRNNRWGGHAGELNSGSGSNPEHAERYAEMVRAFVRARNVRRVVDLGCGDFKVASRLLDATIEYIGVDIVPDVIEQNQRLYGGPHVQFRCLDLIEDALPDGDLCLVRQVFQHLSNEQIVSALRNLGRYPYVLVTEHYPSPAVRVRPNLDKPCGEDVRTYDGSGVYLDQPPFFQAIAGPLLDVDAGDWLMRPGERIRTFLIERGLRPR